MKTLQVIPLEIANVKSSIVQVKIQPLKVALTYFYCDKYLLFVIFTALSNEVLCNVINYLVHKFSIFISICWLLPMSVRVTITQK
jgi:hypothetical protein